MSIAVVVSLDEMRILKCRFVKRSFDDDDDMSYRYHHPCVDQGGSLSEQAVRRQGEGDGAARLASVGIREEKDVVSDSISEFHIAGSLRSVGISYHMNQF